MSYNEHGGNCCGISHVFYFPLQSDLTWLNTQIQWATQDTLADNEELVESGDRQRWRGKFGHAIEVCLTDDQMMVWAETLKKKGFKLGLRWLNDNSGNYCNLLSWAPKRAGKKRPYKW
jgi:aryl carrier-like protein